MSLSDRLLVKLSECIPNRFYDNYDWEIRNFRSSKRVWVMGNRILDSLLSMVGFEPMAIVWRNNYWKLIGEFSYLYDHVEDEESKERLVELLAYRLLGYHKVKLSRNTPELWRLRKLVKNLIQKDRIKANYRTGYLHRYDLSTLGYKLDLFFTTNGIVIEYLLEQYRYGDKVFIQPGDVAIDCGSCWGDTALYFAYKGASKVYAFEFIPSNLHVLDRNCALNPEFCKKLHVIQHPVWSESGVDLSFADYGPASRVGEMGKYPSKTTTLSIDDLVQDQIGGKVDFIKMDIEGAEVPALNGARNTIVKYKPKLAISVYHRPDDMITIPRLIKEMRNDYKFYLDYYTIVGDEIVLYAV